MIKYWSGVLLGALLCACGGQGQRETGVAFASNNPVEDYAVVILWVWDEPETPNGQLTTTEYRRVVGACPFVVGDPLSGGPDSTDPDARGVVTEVLPTSAY